MGSADPTSRFSRRLLTGTFHTRKVLISSHDDNQSDHQLKKKMMPALLTKISGELTRNNINNNNNNNICLPPNVETWITEPSNCHLAVLLYINFNSRENRVNNMWSFKRNTSLFEYYLVPFPEFQPSAGDFFKKKCIRKSSTGLRVCS